MTLLHALVNCGNISPAQFPFIHFSERGILQTSALKLFRIRQCYEGSLVTKADVEYTAKHLAVNVSLSTALLGI